ncbi:hypothetical protein [Elioraea sp.]|uniref:hypothetical protein n=1 Tax=Elioraea sp. TaxID=2185103 RepID=UPI0025BF7A9B|nr:hypothetical protein [Elioraea sp.]
MTRTWRVSCGDFFHFMDTDEEWTVEGFQTAEAAREYARRFIRSHIERLRTPDPVEHHSQYMSFGEYASAGGFDSSEWVAWCIASPATRPEHTDYLALDPTPRKAAS